MTAFSVHEKLAVQDGETIVTSEAWWTAVVRGEGSRGPEGADSLWQRREKSWRRQQKAVIRSPAEWDQDQAVSDELVSDR